LDHEVIRSPWGIGSSEADTLVAGPGLDTLYGSGGNDTFVFIRGQGNGDVVADFAGNGAAAGDQFQFIGYGTAASTCTMIR
jgi:Ca2+-binding RTX toxin-like protein